MSRRSTAKLSLGKVYFASKVLVRFLIIFLHRFPSTKTPLYSEWIQLVQQHLKAPHFVPNMNSKVCSNHFEERCLDRSQRRVFLIEGSRPTLFYTSEDAAQQVFN